MRTNRSLRTLSGAALAVLSVAFATPAEAQSGPFQFYPLAPCRVVDTRATGFTPALAGQLPTDPVTPRDFTIKGAKKYNDPATDCGVPLDAKAVAINVTIAGPTEAGYVSLWPAGTTKPSVSTINFTTADYALANGAVVALASATPDLSTYFGSWPTRGAVHLILDVNGYFR